MSSDRTGKPYLTILASKLCFVRLLFLFKQMYFSQREMFFDLPAPSSGLYLLLLHKRQLSFGQLSGGAVVWWGSCQVGQLSSSQIYDLSAIDWNCYFSDSWQISSRLKIETKISFSHPDNNSNTKSNNNNDNSNNSNSIFKSSICVYLNLLCLRQHS